MERVKLFSSSKHDDNWEEEGNGYLRIETTGDSDKTHMVVKSEDLSEILLDHEIGVTTTEYSLKPDARIIQWTDTEIDILRAVRFETDTRCQEIFRKLRELCPKSAEEEEEEVTSSEKQIPDLTIASLDTLVKAMTDPQLLPSICRPTLVPNLIEVFQQCEDLEDVAGLENCCRLTRTLIIHADFSTAEVLFAEENALHVIGSLEFDPDIPVRIKHRQYLQEKVRFKEVMPIKDPEIVRRIHQIYRMQYVKDVILPRLLDEPVYSCLSHMIMVGNMDVVTGLSSQLHFFEDLFTKIRESCFDSREWQELVGFLQEYCAILRQLQPVSQVSILVKMEKAGLFEVLTEVMKRGTAEMQLKAIDILSSSLAQDPSLLRNHLIKTPKHLLFQLLVETIVTGDEMGLTEHSLDVIRSLLEPTEEMVDMNDAFREMFYKHYAPYLIDALSLSPARSLDKGKGGMGLKVPEKVSPRAKGAILELFGFCVHVHLYEVKCCFLRERVLDRVLSLLKAQEKWLVVSVVRFFRALVGMMDEFYDRILQRADALGLVIEVFLENGDRNNLLNSSILELFDFLWKKKRHLLVAQVVEHHIGKLTSITYVHTFQKMKNEYEKKKEGGCSLQDTSMIDSQRLKRESRTMEREEEDYFAEGSDDNEGMDEHVTTSSAMDVDSMDRCKRSAGVETDNASPKRLRSEETTSTAETTALQTTKETSMHKQ